MYKILEIFHFYFVCVFLVKKGKSGRVIVRGKGRAATVAAVVTAP